MPSRLACIYSFVARLLHTGSVPAAECSGKQDAIFTFLGISKVRKEADRDSNQDTGINAVIRGHGRF